ncbi:MAG: helix-turn-helix domain-containing protein [Bacteroidales bacterium]|jgi:YesN/AraC family two-component response regulator|nr:helix-turn-helix domain-containing protein [Bacteroidales bacterium]
MSEILFRFPPAFVGYIKENNTHEYGELEFDKFYRHCFCSLKLYYGDEENLFCREIIMNTLRNFFLDVYDKIKRHESLEHSSRSRKTGIMERFCSLVLKHFKTSREVSFYAEKLHITPKYLSAILKELDMDKRSAKEWIDSCTVVEIKLLLKSTELSIQEISNELNFPNPSFFCKYFKSCVGMSPKEYREC